MLLLILESEALLYRWTDRPIDRQTDGFFSIPNVMAIFDGEALTGAQKAGRVRKNAILDRYLASSHVVNGPTAKSDTHSSASW